MCSNSRLVHTVLLQPNELFFCTKIAQCGYAECVRQVPFTQPRGEPVTFFDVSRASTRLRHVVNHDVKSERRPLEPPIPWGFYRVFQWLEKKPLRIDDLSTLVAFTPTSLLKRSLEAETLKANKNSGRVARRRFKRYTKDSFNDDQASTNNA